MSGVGESVVLQPNGAVGVPVASVASSNPPADAATIAKTGDAVSAGAAATSPIPLANGQASQVPAGGVATAGNAVVSSLVPIVPSITHITAAAEDTAISVISVPANSNVPAPKPPGQEAAGEAGSTSNPPVETTPPAPAPAAATSELPPPAESPPPAETSTTEVPPAPAETSLPSSLAPPAEKSDSIPSAIGDANIFAPAESQASETPTELVAAATTSSSLPADSVSAAESSSSLPPQSVSSSTAAAATSSSVVSAQASVSASSRSTSSHASSNATSGSARTSSQSHTQATSSKSDDKLSAEESFSSQSTTEAAKPTKTSDKGTSAVPDTTYVSGSVTLTGTAAISAAEFAHGADHKEAKNGMSSFGIIGIVGGILVFFILLYIAWFQWRKRRNRDESERLDDEDTYNTSPTGFDPYGLADEKHSGFDFIDQPLSSRRSQKHRTGVTTMYTENPFADQNEQYQRRLETEYVDTWYSDPGEAGLGTARSKSMKWYEDDRRPSYIDGPRSIYHDMNDPSDPSNQYPEGRTRNGEERERERERPSSVPASARTLPGPSAPPVPPLPAAYRKSDPHSVQSLSRPQTNFTYGDYLTGYDTATSRPATQYTQYTHDNPPQTSSTMMDSPNTAAMLPWLHSDMESSPPMPQPVDPRSMPTHHGQSKNGFGSPPRMPLRGPVAAAMAQTPQMEDRGFQGVIPTFR